MESTGSTSVSGGAGWRQCGKYSGHESISPQDQTLVFCVGNASDPYIADRAAVCHLEKVDVIEL